METKYNHEEVLIKYLLEQSTSEEQDYVEKWVAEAEEHATYFQNLRNTLALINIEKSTSGIDINEEWVKMQENLQNASKNSKETPIVNLEEEISEHSTKSIVIRRLMIAASIAAALFVGIFLLVKKEPTQRQPVLAEVKKDTTAKKEIAKDEVVREKNTTNRIKKFTLPDGTVVRLYPKSEFTYSIKKDKKCREVNMSGVAGFAVAKDTSHPFIVISEGVTTKALGTDFTVTARPNTEQFVVRLDEGKVMVRYAVTRANAIGEIILDPGQELVYNVKQKTAFVRNAKKKNSVEHNDSLEKDFLDDPKFSSNEKRSWFMFNNRPLNEIFDALELMYNAEILYSREAINKIYFIGKFDKTDSLSYILKQIADINNLEVENYKRTYIIKKPTK